MSNKQSEEIFSKLSKIDRPSNSEILLLIENLEKIMFS